ncbi:MAG: Hsp20/alpha crystallin family protein [Candidatus Dojkabacteria bacterium]|jgi:HSP20 family protein
MKIVKIDQKPQETYYTPLRSFMDEFFGYSPLGKLDDMYAPFESLSADIWEEDNKIFVKMPMPGLKKEDVKITVNGDILSVEGKSKEDKEEKDGKKYLLRSSQSYSYSQRFSLPSTVESSKVEAKMEDGVLSITLPKAKESKTKEIEIK